MVPSNTCDYRSAAGSVNAQRGRRLAGERYGFSALAQIKWRIVDRRALDSRRFARDMIVAVLSLVFSILFIWYSRNTGHSFFVYWAPFLLAGGALLLGIPVYAAQRGKMAEPPAIPEYR